ncbi:hypothetical protein ABE59_06380 [Bacillus safensis]|nr:hypothetical protein BSL056_15515 [Bacillus safensis]MBG9820338.1 hypothetical protein [Bacillus safensis]
MHSERWKGKRVKAERTITKTRRGKTYSISVICEKICESKLAENRAEHRKLSIGTEGRVVTYFASSHSHYLEYTGFHPMKTPLSKQNRLASHKEIHKFQLIYLRYYVRI